MAQPAARPDGVIPDEGIATSRDTNASPDHWQPYPDVGQAHLRNGDLEPHPG